MLGEKVRELQYTPSGSNLALRYLILRVDWTKAEPFSLIPESIWMVKDLNRRKERKMNVA